MQLSDLDPERHNTDDSCMMIGRSLHHKHNNHIRCSKDHVKKHNKQMKYPTNRGVVEGGGMTIPLPFLSSPPFSSSSSPPNDVINSTFDSTADFECVDDSDDVDPSLFILQNCMKICKVGDMEGVGSVHAYGCRCG